MGYMHIENLYKVPDIFLFKKVFALEKIHGTSAHLSWSVDQGKETHEGVSSRLASIRYHPGGEKLESFLACFDEPRLRAGFESLGHPQMTIFGEFYGGRCQGMRDTYGEVLRFVAFDVRVGDSWLSVPNAADVSAKLGLEFVHFEEVAAEVAALDAVRDAQSVQAVRNGILEPRAREGVVLRPLVEFMRSNGSRVIAKYKGEKFSETKTARPVDVEKLRVLEDAERVAEEWVVPTRLMHVLDKHPAEDMGGAGDVIRVMIEDVRREGEGEIAWSKDVEKAIGRATALLLKRHFASRVGGQE